MKHSSIKKLLTSFLVTTAVVAAATISASACTSFYVGGNLTQEGTPFIARTEDYGSDMNKLWFISPAGAFDGTYQGCPGDSDFTYELSHPSYQFTYFKNDNGWGPDYICPECKQKNTLTGPGAHLSYTEFGTNQYGVSVSATETITSLTAVTNIDPFLDDGIEETDIPTVLLSEAKTAREALDLYLEISDTKGHAGKDGIFIMDQKEIWYIENCSGTQYVAVRLNDDMMFFEPNISIIGEIDLDDTENIIASPRLIEVAKQAGTFVGDEDENIINFRASYAKPDFGIRVVDGIHFINEAYSSIKETDLTADNTKCCISNVKDGQIVQPYTNLEADRTLTKNDVFNFYKLSSVGKPGNQEIEIFQIFKDKPLATGTVGWITLGNTGHNVFVPYYPMYLADPQYGATSDDLYEGYQVSLPIKTTPAEQPQSGFYFKTKPSANYTLLPENWRDSYYFSFEALGDYMLYAEYTDGAVKPEDRQYVLDQLNNLQQKFYVEFNAMQPSKTAQVGADMAKRAHMLALELIDYVTSPETAVDLTHMNGNTQIEIKHYQPGATVTAAAALTKSGYTFLGWDTASAASTVVYKPGDQFEITENTILYAVWQEQSSGGGSSSSTYAVTVSAASDGSVTASPKQAAKGSTITLTIKPNSGYQLDTLKVTDKGGNTIKTTANSNGTYTFQMPASAVTVKATFVKIEQVWKNPFQDVSSGSWYYEAVRYATENRLFSGISENTFAPNSGLTRGMLVQVLWSMAGKPVVSSEISFSDVVGNAWYAEAVRWATANHIVSGIGDGKFGSDAGITREQLALILYNYAGKPTSPSQQLNFADADKAASWSVDALRWAIGAGLFSGRTGGILDPQGPATRAEMAQIMMKFGQL